MTPPDPPPTVREAGEGDFAWIDGGTVRTLVGGGDARGAWSMIEHWTPPIYRQPTLPISALAYWAATQIWQKSRKTQCEEEIAAYRALIDG